MSLKSYHTTAEASTERLSGTIERTTFHSEATGFCVLQIHVKGQRDLITVTGSVACAHEGEYVECMGNWVRHPKHGLQFNATTLKTVPPSSIIGIKKYLSSGMVAGIGPHFAQKLINAFQADVFRVIEEEPERLLSLKGIGLKRQQQLVTSWKIQKKVRDIMVFLQSHGMGSARAARIYKTYGDNALETIRKNPYRLAQDIHGIGFKTADALAQSIGIPRDSLIRAQAGICHVLKTASTDGHCAMTREALIASSITLLEIPTATLNAAIDAEQRAKNIVPDRIDDEDCFFIAQLYHAECNTAQKLQILQKPPLPWGNIDWEKALPWVEAQAKIMLSASQKEAIKNTLMHKVTIITGGPGVGKTTIIDCILRIVKKKEVALQLCAPTGRAAKRLSETTGLTAKTIHRLLAFNPSTRRFKYDSDHPIPTDFIIVDEISMIDILLMQQLIRALPRHAALLMVGDIDQLPSVGPGAVLADMIASETIATVRLTEIFRQAASSRIIVNAHRINRGAMPYADPPQGKAISDFYLIESDTPESIQKTLVQIVCQRIPQRFRLNPLQDIQVLSPMNKGALGTSALNLCLQESLNSGSETRIMRYGTSFAPGDKVIQMVNNYDKEIFNGDIGFIQHIDRETSTVTVDFEQRLIRYDFSELDELALAYAITIHKSQGSEYPAVVIPLATQHYTLLERNLLYTAITRGKQLVVIVGQKKALAMAVHRNNAKKRRTQLAARLQRPVTD